MKRLYAMWLNRLRLHTKNLLKSFRLQNDTHNTFRFVSVQFAKSHLHFTEGKLAKMKNALSLYFIEHITFRLIRRCNPYDDALAWNASILFLAMAKYIYNLYGEQISVYLYTYGCADALEFPKMATFTVHLHCHMLSLCAVRFL